MASALNWIPDSLYNSAVTSVVCNYRSYKTELKLLPEDVQFDVYYKLYEQGRLCQLGMEFSNLDIFAKALKVANKRILLHQCFQALMDHGTRVSRDLSDAYCLRHNNWCILDATVLMKGMNLGLLLGNFLSEAGWYEDSEKVLLCCLQMCLSNKIPPYFHKALECCHRLLHVQITFCRYGAAEETHQTARQIIQVLKETEVPNLSGLYGVFAGLYFYKSHYNEAYAWGLEALSKLTSNLPPKIIVDILRQTAKACVVKREFKKARLLIKQAVHLSREVFGERHPKYAEVLLDYGFYLLNVDSIHQSVQVYQTALDIQLCIFGGRNLHVAVAHEDLAYALYVHEYSSGRFLAARDHADKALSIMRHLIPEDHLLLASSKRVKALILEEIAIDNQGTMEKMLLEEAQELHLAALTLARAAFGEINVQTAKHYGNLGRLYQSMKKFSEAEAMHLKAIEIKENLLGTEDYEVALSVGHLASLYNYDMMEYTKAERLYLRSIEIGCKLFGETYSGLEYDYRGLLQVYRKEGNATKVMQYISTLNHWKALRDDDLRHEVPPLNCEESSLPMERVIQEFFQMVN